MTATRNLFWTRSRTRAFRARGSCRLTTLGVTELVVVEFKVAVPLLLALVVGTPSRSGSVLAGVSKDVVEKSAAGMKLIRKPSQVGYANFCRLCDLRSREVCLCRAPKDSRD